MAVPQKAPSVATVIIIAHGSTTAANSTSPQPQPRVLSHGALRSQAHRARAAKITVSRPTGPLIRAAIARPPQKASLVQTPGVRPARWSAYIRARAAMARVVKPHRAASVLAMKASLDSRKVEPSIAPASRPVRGSNSAAAPQAQAAAASIAPSRDGMR